MNTSLIVGDILRRPKSALTEHKTGLVRGVASSPQLQGVFLFSLLVGMLVAAAHEG